MKLLMCHSVYIDPLSSLLNDVVYGVLNHAIVVRLGEAAIGVRIVSSSLPIHSRKRGRVIVNTNKLHVSQCWPLSSSCAREHVLIYTDNREKRSHYPF